MIIDQPGKVTERIYLLGRRETCVYLLDGGDACALIGGGMAYIVPDILKQIKALGVDEEKIERIIVLHSHFDHCGAVASLKKRWPRAVVSASARAAELLAKPKVVDSIAQLNRDMAAVYGIKPASTTPALEFAPAAVEQTLNDGDRLPCGALEMQILAVPGHSSCSIAVHVPAEDALFASDAGGIPFGDKIFTAANSNFDLYQQSLEKMARLKASVHLAEHYGARTGEDGRRFLTDAIAAAAETRKLYEATWRRIGDLQQSIDEVTDHIMAQAPAGFLPRRVIALVTGQMMRYIARSMENRVS